MTTNNHSLEETYWQDKLTPEQFSICRLKSTEPPFTGKYTYCKKAGTYHCVCCDNPLFSSETKYDSGSGWPSFWEIDLPTVGYSGFPPRSLSILLSLTRIARLARASSFRRTSLSVSRIR